MNYIITEQQMQIITEGVSSAKFSDNMRKLNSFSTKMMRKVEKKYGLNLRLLATWGPAVGGFVLPLDNFIKTHNFELDESQSALILAGVAATIFFDNKPAIKKIVEKIKEEGLLDVFDEVLVKGGQLKNSFRKFMESLGTSITSVSEIVSYGFLIPIIGDIQNIIGKNPDLVSSAELITQRLLASGLVIVTAITLNEVINKILRKLS
jgi:hypothetical protein